MASELHRAPREDNDGLVDEQQAGRELSGACQELITERFGSAQDLAAELLGSTTTDTQAAAAAGREARR